MDGEKVKHLNLDPNPTPTPTPSPTPTPTPTPTPHGVQVKCVVLTEPAELSLVQKALEEAGYECSGQLVHVPLTTVACSEEDMATNYAAIDKLEELDDVTSVEHNMAFAASAAA